MEPETTRNLPDSKGLFREDALRHYFGNRAEGNVLRVTPRWTRWTFWFLVACVSIGLTYAVVGTVPVYESGPAILTVDGRMPVTSPVGGVIESVHVLPGQLVAAGDFLAEFRADQERSDVTRVENEFELQLLAHLRDPSDLVADRELRRLRPELERARSRLDQRRVRAPRDGAVQDVRIRAGEYLAAGAPVVSLVPADPQYSVIAFMPGHALPQLEIEMPVRLAMSGYAYAYVTTTIESIGRQAIGPGEARRYLGQDIGDTVELGGPVVVVRCRLPSDRFVASRREYRVYDGMQARAEVRLRRERLIFRLVPALKVLDPRRV